MVDDALFKLLAPARRTAIVNIGAGDIGDTEIYQPLLDRDIGTVVGFEPLPEQFEILQARQTKNCSTLPYAVGDGRTHTMHVCAFWPMSSLLRPDPNQLQQFIPFTDLGRVTKETPVQTHRLDEIREIEAIDILKIDVQGFELTIFQNGRNKLREAVAVQVELPFIKTYQNQPTFGEVDLELQSLGFVPHFFVHASVRMVAPMMPTKQGQGGLRQIHEVDLLYVRNFARAELMSDEQLKHLALLAHHCFGSFDLAYRCVFALTERGSLEMSARDRYLNLLKPVPK
jgi:FkbM family methyltransferase